MWVIPSQHVEGAASWNLKPEATICQAWSAWVRRALILCIEPGKLFAMQQARACLRHGQDPNRPPQFNPYCVDFVSGFDLVNTHGTADRRTSAATVL